MERCVKLHFICCRYDYMVKYPARGGPLWILAVIETSHYKNVKTDAKKFVVYQ